MKLLRILSYGVLALLTVLLMVATIVERRWGTDTAHSLIYDSPVIIVLWAVSAYSALVVCSRSGIKKHPVTLLIHLSLITILIGGFVTGLFGEHGTLHLRQGEPEHHVILSDGRMVMLPCAVCLREFEVVSDPDSGAPADYISTLGVVTEEGGWSEAVVSMNHIWSYKGWQFCQADFDPDMQGTVLSVCHDPWGIGISFAAYGLLFAALVVFFFTRGTRFRELLSHPLLRGKAMVAPLTLLGLVIIGFAVMLITSWHGESGLAPVLRTPLLGVHVSIIIFSYALLATIAVCSICGLLSRSDDSQRLQVFTNILLYPAVFLLTIGIFIGAVWGDISWGRYWSWDPKETWALVTMLTYAFAFHARSLPWFRKPSHWHLFTLLAILCVAVTYFGVNLLFGGLHAYGR